MRPTNWKIAGAPGQTEPLRPYTTIWCRSGVGGRPVRTVPVPTGGATVAWFPPSVLAAQPEGHIPVAGGVAAERHIVPSPKPGDAARARNRGIDQPGVPRPSYALPGYARSIVDPDSGGPGTRARQRPCGSFAH